MPDRPRQPLESAILEVLCRAPCAWQNPVELGRALNVGVDVIEDALLNLDLEAMIAVWEQPCGIAVTLSRKAATALGVQLVKGPAGAGMRWRRAQSKVPHPRQKATSSPPTQIAPFAPSIGDRRTNPSRTQSAPEVQPGRHTSLVARKS